MSEVEWKTQTHALMLLTVENVEGCDSFRSVLLRARKEDWNAGWTSRPSTCAQGVARRGPTLTSMIILMPSRVASAVAKWVDGSGAGKSQRRA